MQWSKPSNLYFEQFSEFARDQYIERSLSEVGVTEYERIIQIEQLKHTKQIQIPELYIDYSGCF